MRRYFLPPKNSLLFTKGLSPNSQSTANPSGTSLSLVSIYSHVTRNSGLSAARFGYIKRRLHADSEVIMYMYAYYWFLLFW